MNNDRLSFVAKRFENFDITTVWHCGRWSHRFFRQKNKYFFVWINGAVEEFRRHFELHSYSSSRRALAFPSNINGVSDVLNWKWMKFDYQTIALMEINLYISMAKQNVRLTRAKIMNIICKCLSINAFSWIYPIFFLFLFFYSQFPFQFIFILNSFIDSI